MSQGIGAWAFYLAGTGAFNNWTPADVDVLRQGGMTHGLPIFVPALDLAGDPVADANAFADAIAAAGVSGVGVLDTEAAMRGNPNLASYVDAFVGQLRARGMTPAVYGGGNYVPAGVPPWWPVYGATSAPAGQALQTGTGSLDGLGVDWDVAGAGFPFAPLVADPPPPPAPPAPPAPTTQVPQEVIMGLPTGCTDQGAVRCQIREWWDTYRDDPMSAADQDFWLTLFYRPPNEPMLGIPGMAGNPDALLAGIVDNANAQGHLRPQFANAV